MKRKKVDLLKCSSLMPDGPGSSATTNSSSHVDKLLSVHDRVIAHIDLDCFYVQVERSLDPTLRSKPVAVVQYNPFGDLRTYLPSDNRIVSSGSLIAVSYEARAAGVKRIMRGQEAKKACPELLLVQVPTSHGKANLGIYREASSRILKVLSSTSYSSCIIERASIDEVYVDVTAEASRLLEQATDLRLFLQSSIKLLLSVPTLIAGVDDEEVSMNKSQIRNGHKGTELMQHSYLNDDSNHMMPVPDEIPNASSSAAAADEWFLRPQHLWSTQDLMLVAGSIVVNDLRKAVLQHLGFTCSAGIATNRMLAKTCSGMHKPNKQTILPVAFISSLMTSLPYSRVQGLGGKLGDALSQLYGGTIKAMGDIAAIDRKELIQRFGEETAAWLYNVSRGIDVEPVMDRPLPISIGCSKSFRSSNMLTPKHLSDGTVLKWLTELCEELQERLSDDMQQNNRVPKSLQAGASIKFQLLSSSSSDTSLSGNDDNKQNESGGKESIVIPIEDRVEQWHEDQGISLSKICPMVSGGSSAMAKTALQMLTRAIHEHPKICSLNVKSNSSSSIATSGSPNKLIANSSSSSSINIVHQYSWNITYLSMCVNNFQTIENGSNSITSYFKVPSAVAFLCAENHSSTSPLNLAIVNDEKLTRDDESADTSIQRQHVDHSSVVEVLHTERTQEEEGEVVVSSSCGRSSDKVLENMMKTQDNNQTFRDPQSVTAAIISKANVKPEHRMITSFFSHAAVTKRSISVVVNDNNNNNNNSNNNSTDGHLDQRDDSRSSTSYKAQRSGNDEVIVISEQKQQLTTKKKSSDTIFLNNCYPQQRNVVSSQSSTHSPHPHMPTTMRDIDSSVFLSLPHDIQREIELTLKLRQQRNHSTK